MLNIMKVLLGDEYVEPTPEQIAEERAQELYERRLNNKVYYYETCDLIRANSPDGVREYVTARLTGRCRTGSDSSGELYHAVPYLRSGDALCGRTAGRLSAGWHERAGQEVTCKRCAAKLRKMGAQL